MDLDFAPVFQLPSQPDEPAADTNHEVDANDVNDVVHPRLGAAESSNNIRISGIASTLHTCHPHQTYLTALGLAIASSTARKIRVSGAQ